MSEGILHATVIGLTNPVEVVTGSKDPQFVKAGLIVDNEPAWIDVKINRQLRATVRTDAIVALWVEE